MRKILSPKFFARPALEIAPQLLGKYLVIQNELESRAYKITEVEAYTGEEDLASHARHGKTHRTAVMYGHPGFWYVYLIYGMYWMLNIVCQPEGQPEAVLIRGVEGILGPGRVTKMLGITKHFNAQPATPNTGLWIEDRSIQINKKDIQTSPRIGVDYAGPIWSQKHYRFFLGNGQSKTLPPTREHQQ